MKLEVSYSINDCVLASGSMGTDETYGDLSTEALV